jgi:hypothetical protein
MSRRRQADNRQVVAVPIFQADPVGHRMFADITGAVTGPLIGSRPVVEHGSGQWSGWAQDPQRLRGLASLGRGRPITERSSQLADERSLQMSNPALAVFAQRATRGQP